MIFELKYRPDVLRTLKQIKIVNRVDIIVKEFLESGMNYVQLDYESCGCRPKSKVANINRYVYRHGINAKAIMVGDKCYIVRIDGNEKSYRSEISKIYK